MRHLIKINVNGRDYEVAVRPGTTVLDLLRNELLLLQCTQRAHYGVVLHAARDTVVAGMQHAVDGYIQRLSGIAGKYDAQGIIDPEDLGKGLAAINDDATGLYGEPVT